MVLICTHIMYRPSHYFVIIRDKKLINAVRGWTPIMFLLSCTTLIVYNNDDITESEDSKTEVSGTQ